jgi:hypothetical protein
MVKSTIETHDHIQQYCRMLGHKVAFSYCRKMNNELPCRNALDCWKNIFAVEEFIQNFYSEEEIARFLEPPKPKLAQIYDLMIQAKKTTSKK